MSDYRYKVELIENIPEEIELKRVVEMVSKSEWYGHSYADAVGRIYEDGRVESFFIHDGEGSEWFDKLRNANLLKSRHRNLMDRETCETFHCEEFYLMRKVVGSYSDKPTVSDECLDTCMNVDYDYTYEILFVGDEDHKRYVYNTVKTSGPHTYCLMDEVDRIEDMLEEWAEEKTNGFYFDEDENIVCKMYDDYGYSINATYNSARELMMCINSIRLVDLNYKIVDRQN